MSNSLDPDQARLFVGPDVGPNCFKGYVFLPSTYFLKLTFFKNYFENTIRVSNSLNLDQARHFAGPDLGPNRLQRLSAAADSTSRQRYKYMRNYPARLNVYFLSETSSTYMLSTYKQQSLWQDWVFARVHPDLRW